MINYFILAVAFLTLILTFLIWRSERDKELSRLKSLFDHLIFIRDSAKGHEKHLKYGGLPLPSWPVANMDLNFYLTQLNYTMRKEWSLCCHESTRRLKKGLIRIFEKINNINYLWKLKIEKPKVKSDLETNTYYSDLYGFIENALYEIKRIIK